MLPTALRFATPNEMKDAQFSGTEGEPAVRGDTPGTGANFDCLKCGAPVVRDMPPGWLIEMNLKCGGCGTMLRLVY